MDDKKIIFALDIGTRSVVGVVGSLQDGNFNILDYEQEFHEKRAMRDGQIEDIDMVAQVASRVKAKLEQRTGQIFTKVSIAAAGRALRTAAASFSLDLISNEPITPKILQHIEYSAIQQAQESFLADTPEQEGSLSNYYCVGYSVKDYLLDDYKIKNLEGQKGSKATVNIIAAFLPSSVLISLYAVTAQCGLEVDNLTLEPIAAIHAVVPDDVRFLNIALVDIGGGTSDIAISKDGSVVAYDMVTTAGDEITEALMRHYLTNFATAERIKLMLNGEESISFKDILGNSIELTPDEAFAAVQDAIHTLAEAISQRILLINGTAPAAVFLVGGGSQIRGLCQLMAEKLGMIENRVAIGVVNTDTNLTLFSDSLYNPTFVTPIGIGIVSSLYRGCDFFTITVNGKRIMMFNQQSIKVIDALLFSGVKPAGLISLTPPHLSYTLNGKRRIAKSIPGIPGELLVNGAPATVETEIRQGDEITAIPAQNGKTPVLSLGEALSEFLLSSIRYVLINDIPVDIHQGDTLNERKISYMDQIVVPEPYELAPVPTETTEVEAQTAPPAETQSEQASKADVQPLNDVLNPSELSELAVEINKIYSRDLTSPRVSLLLAETDDGYEEEDNEAETDAPSPDATEIPAETQRIALQTALPATTSAQSTQEKDPEPLVPEETPLVTGGPRSEIKLTLNGNSIHLVQETDEPLIVMHLLKYVDLDPSNPRGDLLMKLNGQEANYADPLHDHDVVIIKWSED
ncbi:cell division protein FtsA [Aminipila butyrica]|uniref:Cell division protein FtsA n=1 Tax=Aminipila butyrica TaxID=433296 RepID=A0A858BS38_9FIRM|nr:cell division protein FtsA [Aminipila butyrica]QIB68397.1 cell division protein FtsA [Aminipila butyrica]